MIKDNTQSSFLPTSAKEMEDLGWEQADVILFSGDAYIDHPSFGTAIIARVLEAEGLQVAVVSQPNWRDDLRDFKKLGEPRLFFAVTAGSMDSMVNHYTAGKRKRSDDAYTPDGRPGQRPDDASIVYCNILKDMFPEVPIVLGGVEASLRRFTHYDYWKDAVRPTILEESKADLLTYGMSEQPIQEIVRLMQKGVPFHSLTTIPQTAYLTGKIPQHKEWKDLNLHSFANNSADKRIFAQDFRTVEENGNTYQKYRFLQVHGDLTLVVNPSNPPMSTKTIDAVYDLPYTRLPHPRYKDKRIPAFDMIKNSVTTHRGCFGGCSFCAIYSHQGKFISSRSKSSIMAEVDEMVTADDFKGTISDLGGPSANMYRMAGEDLDQCKACRRVSCIFPKICKNLNTDHQPTTDLFRTAAANSNVKHCYVASGIRHDMLIDEKGSALSRDKATYLQEMITKHTSGRLTVAPEHTSDRVLKLMRKPSYKYFEAFEKVFKRTVEKAGKKFQLVPYFISAHPGSESEDMAELAVHAKSQNLYLEQVQDFTPTPMSLATTMYYTGINPYNSESVYTAKSREDKINQKRFFFWYKKEEREAIRTELRKMGRNDLETKLFMSKYKMEEDEPRGRGRSRGVGNSKRNPASKGKGKITGKFHDKPNKFSDSAKSKSRSLDMTAERAKGKFGDRPSDKPRFSERSSDKPAYGGRSADKSKGQSGERSSDKPRFSERSGDKPSYGGRSGDKPKGKFGERSSDKPRFSERSGDKPSYGGRSSDKPKGKFGERSSDKPRFSERSGDKPSFGGRSGDKSKGRSSERSSDNSKDKPRFKENTKFKHSDKPKFQSNSKTRSKPKGRR